MRRWVLRLGLVGGMTSASLACTSSSNVFTCASDTDCTGEGVGTCQSNGFCAFPDAMCESGSRYGELAGGGFANMCVPQDEPGETEPAGGSTGSSTSTGPPATTLPTGGTLSTTVDSDPTRGEGGSSTGSQESSTGAASPCELSFEDDFDEQRLPPHWEAIGPGTVDVNVGELRLGATPEAGDQPTWVRHGPGIGFESVWLGVEIDTLPNEDGLQAILSLTRDAGNESFDLLVDASGEIIARRWSIDGSYTDLATAPFILEDYPWLRIRESDGRVAFEFGAGPQQWQVFHEADEDIRGWSGSLYVGADNYLELSDEEPISYEWAAACVVP